MPDLGNANAGITNGENHWEVPIRNFPLIFQGRRGDIQVNIAAAVKELRQLHRGW